MSYFYTYLGCTRITFKVEQERRVYWSKEEQQKAQLGDWVKFKYNIFTIGVLLRNGREVYKEEPGYNIAPTCDQVRQIKAVALANSRK